MVFFTHYCFMVSPNLQTIYEAQESIPSPVESIPGLLKRLQTRTLESELSREVYKLANNKLIEGQHKMLWHS
jgi:hypothetical protein